MTCEHGVLFTDICDQCRCPERKYGFGAGLESVQVCTLPDGHGEDCVWSEPA